MTVDTAVLTVVESGELLVVSDGVLFGVEGVGGALFGG